MLEIFSDKAVTDISDSGNGVSESRCRCKSVDFDANFIPILSVSISGLNTRLCEMKIKGANLMLDSSSGIDLQLSHKNALIGAADVAQWEERSLMTPDNRGSNLNFRYIF